MKDITIFGLSIPALIYAPLVYFIWVSILLLVKRASFSRIRKFAERTKTRLDDILLEALDFPLVLLIFVSGAVILERVTPLG